MFKRMFVFILLVPVLGCLSCGSRTSTTSTPEATTGGTQGMEISAPASIEEQVEAIIAENSAYVIDDGKIVDRRDKAYGSNFVSAHLPGASAIYAKNGAQRTFNSLKVAGNGYLTDDDLKNELASKFGYAAAVLVYGKGTEITLKKPEIVTGSDSHANGGFATFGGKLNIYGGTITTNNRLGHGLDATYGGTIYAEDVTIHTSGSNSGALATDFGGGFITVRNIKATAEVAGSPGIYCAGNSIIKAYNSVFESHGCEAVMAAHDGGYTYLYDCTLTGTVGLNGHNSMNPNYSFIIMTGGTLNSTSGALITEMGGKTDMTLERVKVGTVANGNLIAPESGRLIVRLKSMEVAGNVARAPKSYLEIHLTDTVLKGSVDATQFNLDRNSRWEVTGESHIVNLSIEAEKSIQSDKETVVYYNTLTVGGKNIKGDYSIGKVKFTFSSNLIDDYEEAGPPGPPPGEGGPPPEGAPSSPPPA